MTDDEARTLLERIRSFSRARYWKTEQDREDFVSYAVERFLDGRPKNMDWLRVDFLREREAGRKGTSNYDLRLQTVKAIDQGGENDPDELGTRPSQTDAMELQDQVAGVRGPDRAIVLLRGLVGLSEEQIAFFFGVSESRVSQRLSRYQRLRRYFRSHPWGADFEIAL